MDVLQGRERRAEFVELLRTREVRHPSRIVRLASDCASDLSVELSGYPWWLADPQPRCDGSLTLHFEGITDGVLHSDLFHADPFYEDLGSLEARPLTEYKWANGAQCDLFCSTPLPYALGVYVKLHEFLLSVDYPYGPEHYLNMGRSESISELMAIASSTSFLLCRSPEAVCQVVCEAIETHRAKFSLIKGKDKSHDLVCVRLAGSHLICRSAYAVFDR